MCRGVPAGPALPVNLQHLVVKRVRHVQLQPLLALTHPETLTITHGTHGLQHESAAPCDLLALTQLTSLTRVTYYSWPETNMQAAMTARQH